jgi:hypothetical protein
MADRSLSTSEPGALTRELYHAMQDVVISMKDCEDKEGTLVSSSDKKNIGRILAKDVKVDGKRLASRGDICTKKVFDEIKLNPEIKEIYVRTPLTCKAPRGVCQKCYGTIPGTSKELYDIGSPVGAIASQAIGEPASQATMTTFHTGGIGGANVTEGFPKIKVFFGLSQGGPTNKAIIAENSGVVTDIVKHSTGSAIIIEDQKYNIPGDRKILENVKKGEVIKRGDALTDGLFNPHELLKYKGLKTTREYVSGQLKDAFKEALNSDVKVDPRHIELATAVFSSKAQITDPGSADILNAKFFNVPKVLPSQIAPKNIIDRWNELAEKPIKVSVNMVSQIDGAVAAEDIKDRRRNIICKKGDVITRDLLPKISLSNRNVKIYPKKIQYESKIFGTKTFPLTGTENWLSRISYQNARREMVEGALFGQKEQLDEPKTRQMVGKLVNIGKGFTSWLKEKTKDFTEGIGSLFG